VDHGWLLGLWAAWCVLHSLLAADGVSAAIRARIGATAGGYRLFYNSVAAVTLAPVYLATLRAGSPEAWSWQGAWRLPQGALVAAGIGLLVAGARHYDLRQFLGLARGGRGGIAAGGGLETGGVLGLVRHPWYLAGLVLVWSRDLRRLDALVSVVLSVYLVAGALLEERRLVRSFGEAYRRYQRRVPMLLPLPRGGSRRGRDRGKAG